MTSTNEDIIQGSKNQLEIKMGETKFQKWALQSYGFKLARVCRVHRPRLRIVGAII
jgi:hypothetical protein